MTKFLDKFDESISFKSLFSILIVVILFFSSLNTGIVAYATDSYSTDATNDQPIVVSMGDSYSSGEGIEPFYDQYLSNEEKVQSNDWLAHRSEKAWPGMLEIPGLDYKTSNYKDTNWFFVASSGAETKHINYEQKKDYSRGVVGQHSGTKYLAPQIDIFKQLAPNSVDYVTFTFGGNDAGFADIITDAVAGSTYLDLSALSKNLEKTWKKFYKENGIRDDLYNAYKDIEEAAGSQAQIIVAGYPQLLAPDGSGLPISLEEATEINQAVSNFNLAIEEIVNQCASEKMKICFVSVEDAFEGHEAYSRRPYINKVYLLTSKPEDLENFAVASAYSMHPNYDGAIAYAQCVNAKIEQLETEENERIEQEALNPSKKDREIVLVLDASGSMSGNPLSETKKASLKFVETVLASEANISVVSYDSNSTVISPLTDSEEYLDKAINSIYTGGSTNIESGLQMAESILSNRKAKKKIIVLMSDGEPNSGKVGQDLIDYAEELKSDGYYIYTLGFFSALYDKTNAQQLMDSIASEGCHYEVTDAEDLVFFFGDIADQISGEKYIYVRIACPVDVTVTYNGETMSSKDSESYIRTSFGTMTFEESAKKENPISNNNNKSNKTTKNDTRVKILRLKEGVDYDIEIEGNGSGKMNYTIGFVDKNGEYSDMRKFSNISITKQTEIDTVATVSDKTYMYVDEDGDGKYDITYKAEKNSKAEVVDYTYLVYIAIALVGLIILAVLGFVVIRYFKIRKFLH